MSPGTMLALATGAAADTVLVPLASPLITSCGTRLPTASGSDALNP